MARSKEEYQQMHQRLKQLVKEARENGDKEGLDSLKRKTRQVMNEYGETKLRTNTFDAGAESMKLNKGVRPEPIKVPNYVDKIDSSPMYLTDQLTHNKMTTNLRNQGDIREALVRSEREAQKAASVAEKVGDKYTTKLAGKIAKEGLEEGAESGLNRVFKRSASELAKAIPATRAIKKFAGHLPAIGALVGVGTALATGDASAALPDEIAPSDSGPEKGTPEYKFESGTESKADKEERLKDAFKWADKYRVK